MLCRSFPVVDFLSRSSFLLIVHFLAGISFLVLFFFFFSNFVHLFVGEYYPVTRKQYFCGLSSKTRLENKEKLARTVFYITEIFSIGTLQKKMTRFWPG